MQHRLNFTNLVLSILIGVTLILSAVNPTAAYASTPAIVRPTNTPTPTLEPTSSQPPVETATSTPVDTTTPTPGETATPTHAEAPTPEETVTPTTTPASLEASDLLHGN